MVITKTDLDNLPPAERVKRLKELQMKHQQELDELQKEKEEAIKKTKLQLDESIEELEHEDERAQEEDKVDSLEEAIAGDTPEVPESVTYGGALEQLMPKNLQDLSDYNLYGELRSIEEKGYMTPDEQQRVAELREQASLITNAYTRQDVAQIDQARGHYVSRTEEMLKRLENKMHDVKDGMYDANRRDDNSIYR